MEDTRQTILAAFRLVFQPVAKILLRAGVTWKEVAEAGKAVYVEVASRDFGIRGRPTNASRVAILTGLTRKEVGRLRELLFTDESPLIEKMNHATRVLTGWYTDRDFATADGSPKELPPRGGDTSFEALCKRYASDVPPTTMQKELKHVGALEETAAGTLLAKMRYYMPVQMDPMRIMSSGSVLQDLGDTVAYNLYRKTDDRPRFERRASNSRVSAAAAPRFQEFLEREGQAFLERVDQWLTDNEVTDDAENSIRLGLGAYWIQQ